MANYILVEGFSEIHDISTAVELRSPINSYTLTLQAWQVRQKKGQWVAWNTGKIPDEALGKRVILVWPMAMGMGSRLPQPSGQFDLYLNSEKLLSFRLTKSTELWKGQEANFLFEVKRVQIEEEVAVYGLAYLSLTWSSLEVGARATLMVRPRGPESERWLRIDKPFGGEITKNGFLTDGLARVLDARREIQKVGPYGLYWGDIHSHSGGHTGADGCGHGSVDENYIYARDVSNLDIYALTDHDWQLTSPAMWQQRQEKALSYYQPGEFVTFSAYEWSCRGATRHYGHRNIYYLTDDQPFFSYKDENSDTPAKLWAAFERLGTEVISIVHHPSLARIAFNQNWEYHNPKFEPVAEIFSVWGSSERYDGPDRSTFSDHVPGTFLVDALRRGHRLGFIASSDSHDGHPGSAEAWTGLALRPKPYGSGLMAVYAEELTREAVVDALRRRRVYAVTGARILLGFWVAGHFMGEETHLKHGDRPEIRAMIEGTFSLESLEIVRDGQVIWRQSGEGKKAEILQTDEPLAAGLHFYYLRVRQGDGEMAWSSPVWLVVS